MTRLLTIAEWAKRENITPARAYKLIEEGRLEYLTKESKTGLIRMISEDTKKPPSKVTGRPKK